MSQLRRTPIHRVLHRPNLLLGGERNLVLMLLLLTGGIAVASLNLVTTVICGVVWLIGLPILRLMVKADPYMSRVYIRYLQYQKYYPARSTPFCKH